MLGFLIGITSKINAQENQNNEINADAYVVIDSKTGEILLEKNKNKTHFPASITKIVTAIIAIEEQDLNEIVTISQHAQNTVGSSLSLVAGDKIILRDLLYGVMLHSGNDGAVAIAEHISSSETEFSKKMTSFAKSLGANNTNFTNASGLPNDNHYTTANDMAIITRYAMENKVFKEIVQHKQYNWDNHLWRDTLAEHEKIDATRLGIPWEGKPQIINHNRLLDLYKGATGVKNGFTHEARYTLVGSAEKNGIKIISVLLRSKDSDTGYNDMINLLDEGFKTYEEKENNLIVKHENEVISEDKELSRTEEENIQTQSNLVINKKNDNSTLRHGILSILSAAIILLLVIKSKKK
jgi:serine-type D-Ala-D-Ala carboxypeptidase (penicillin-binding protein 5/6)